VSILPPITKQSGTALITNPNRVQGTSQAIEDAACLAELLDRIEDRSQIAEALNLFQRLRQPRCNEIARRAQEVGRVWTLTDGDAQEERDRQLREQEDCEYSNPFSNEGVREVLYKYDMAKDVSDEWERAMSLKMKAPEH
jgi:salicylate hydroxylase